MQETFPGWCCFHFTCGSPINCPCVRVEGCEVCLPCARRVFVVEVERNAERFAEAVEVATERAN